MRSGSCGHHRQWQEGEHAAADGRRRRSRRRMWRIDRNKGKTRTKGRKGEERKEEEELGRSTQYVLMRIKLIPSMSSNEAVLRALTKRRRRQTKQANERAKKKKKTRWKRKEKRDLLCSPRRWRRRSGNRQPARRRPCTFDSSAEIQPTLIRDNWSAPHMLHTPLLFHFQTQGWFVLIGCTLNGPSLTISPIPFHWSNLISN